MVKGGDSNQEMVGSNPGTGYRMDIFTYRYCNVCLKRAKINNKKRPGMAHFYKRVL